MVDTHADVPVEVAGTVVPPGVSLGFGMVQSVGVDESCFVETFKSRSLWSGNMSSTVARTRIPHVDVFRCNVEVAAENRSLIVAKGFAQPSGEAIKPDELGVVERRTHNSAVWRIDADNAHSATDG